jgi:predicted unusual protein kinase regulating ubiquinone biosynthesis (AarF/ABC1/UbiB family)
MMKHDLNEPAIGDVLRSLPPDIDEPDFGRDELQRLLHDIGEKPLPMGRFHRAWTLGTLPAKLTAAYGTWFLRSLFTAGDAKQKLKNEAHLRAGLKLVGSMGYLRGAIAKMGQALACYPDIVPRQMVEMLEALHFEAPPMHYALVREHIRNELGGDPEELFLEFEGEAFAAASLGQVHRARLKTGEEVAVKVQYPNIARTIQADLANLRLLAKPMRLSVEWPFVMDLIEDVESTLVLETDYVHEAEMTERVRQVLSDMDDVVVPRVHKELSSSRVLTLDFIPGIHLTEFRKSNPSQEERDARCEQILGAMYRLWAERLLSSDPNPGNFLLLDDGRLGLIDFGAVREMNDDEWEVMLLGVQGERLGGEALDRALIASTLITEKEAKDEKRMQLLRDFSDWMSEPVKASGAFDFSDEEHFRRGFQLVKEMTLRRYNRIMPVFVWMDRMMFGLRGHFYSLGARVRYRMINNRELARLGLGPPHEDEG